MLTKKISLFFITMFFIQSNESERIHAFFYKNTHVQDENGQKVRKCPKNIVILNLQGQNSFC